MNMNHRKVVVKVLDKSLKRKTLFSLALLAFSLFLFVFSTYAWFTGKFEDIINVEVGFVQVDLDVYFDEDSTRVEATEVETLTDVYKNGVYYVNVVSAADPYYFNDLRLDLYVSSNVDTYFRVKIYEQLTLTIVNYDDSLTELSILIDGYMPFNYETTDWYDNRIYDDYIYYEVPVKRTSETEPTMISLIASAPPAGFSTYPPGYSLQLGFSVEAVQASGGPEHVWDLAEKPWGGSW